MFHYFYQDPTFNSTSCNTVFAPPSMSESTQKKEDIADIIASRPLNGIMTKLRLVLMLTWPAMLAQMSMVVMEYIDAAMVGSLGAAPAAAIGLVATTTWLLWGLGNSASTGFAVQVAHLVGAGNNDAARNVLRQSAISVSIVGLVLATVGVAISGALPHWLGGDEEVCVQATGYFVIFAATLPLMLLTFLSAAMLRCSGNMVLPGMMNVVMCLLDVVFNFFLIYESRTVSIFGHSIWIPGAGMGVPGAALGTGIAFSVGGIWMWRHLAFRSQRLGRAFRVSGGMHWYTLSRSILRKALTISWPMAIERTVMCGAMILITAIVAPLGTASIAANSFAITAESLCYTPGYGVGDAATTLVGQSLGAGRPGLAHSFGRLSIVLGMGIMGVLGVVMWLLAPQMMEMFTPDQDVQSLGVMALRTEAWAEPMFGAAIVIYCIFIGAGYTKVPAAINFGSIWAVRLTLSAFMAVELGLFGVWLAMCIELCVRGAVFLFFFRRGKWLRTGRKDIARADASDPDAGNQMEVI